MYFVSLRFAEYNKPGRTECGSLAREIGVEEKRAVCLSFKSMDKGEIRAIFTKMLRLKG